MSQRPAAARAGRPLGRRRSCGRCCCWRPAGAAVWSVIDPSRAVWVAVAVLIVTCPCALSLAAPAALIAAARGLARRGVLVQRLDALEALATAQHFFFDKTGTLTEDRLHLAAVRADGGRAEARGSTPPGPLRWRRRWPAGRRIRCRGRWPTRPRDAAASAGAHGVVRDRGTAWPWAAARRDDAGRIWRLGSAAWVDAASTGRRRGAGLARLRRPRAGRVRIRRGAARPDRGSRAGAARRGRARSRC